MGAAMMGKQDSYVGVSIAEVGVELDPASCKAGDWSARLRSRGSTFPNSAAKNCYSSSIIECLYRILKRKCEELYSVITILIIILYSPVKVASALYPTITRLASHAILISPSSPSPNLSSEFKIKRPQYP